MTAHFLFFYYFSGVALISSMLTVGLRNPVYCTLSLLSAFFHVAGLFILLEAEFIAAIQIIIYAGAVLVLYLFVLMLLNLKENERFFEKQIWVALVFGLIVLGEILLALWIPDSQKAGAIPGAMMASGAVTASGRIPPSVGNTQAIGLSLFNEYVLQFEVVGVLLLGAVVGALILAKQTPKERKG